MQTNTNDIEQVVYSKTKTVQLDRFVLEKNRITALDKASRESATFDLLRTQILQKMEENNWKSIAIVSPTPESGKTFVAINLSISIAHQPNKSSILVDFDLRRPKVASYLGLKEPYSLNDYLNNQKELDEILVNPSVPKFVVAATNKPTLKSSEMLSTEKVKQFMREIRDRYESRIVVVDLPPVLAVDDALVVLPQVDCVLVVIGAGNNNKKEIIDTMRVLSRFNIVGVVLNKADNANNDLYYY